MFRTESERMHHAISDGRSVLVRTLPKAGWRQRHGSDSRTGQASPPGSEEMLHQPHEMQCIQNVMRLFHQLQRSRLNASAQNSLKTTARDSTQLYEWHDTRADMQAQSSNALGEHAWRQRRQQMQAMQGGVSV